jgi:hypothetical protein
VCFVLLLPVVAWCTRAERQLASLSLYSGDAMLVDCGSFCDSVCSVATFVCLCVCSLLVCVLLENCVVDRWWIHAVACSEPHLLDHRGLFAIGAAATQLNPLASTNWTLTIDSHAAAIAGAVCCHVLF